MTVMGRVKEAEGRLGSANAAEKDSAKSRAIKAEAKRALMERVGFAEVARIAAGLDAAAAREELRPAVEAVLNADGHGNLPECDRELIVGEVLDDVVGLGPLQPLLEDDSVTEIMVNGMDSVFFERAGELYPLGPLFDSEEQIRIVVDRIISPLGRRVDERSPLVNARLPSGYRVNVVIPPAAIDGTCVTIRKFSDRISSLDELVRLGSLPSWYAGLLSCAVKLRQDLAVAGGTGSGKTTLLNACSSFIPDNQRIVTIEDAPELRLQKPHVVRKTARRPNIEGEGEITIRQLVIHALRERPDRIVVGECRGGEAFDMIQAMMTGHEGSLTTVHSSNAREATTRLRSMIQQTGTEMRSEQIMELIASAIDFIVFVNRYDIDGSRKITEIAEVQGMQGDVITIGTIMRFEQTGFSEDGKVLGEFMPTGERITPAHREKLFARGVYVDDDFWFRR